MEIWLKGQCHRKCVPDSHIGTKIRSKLEDVKLFDIFLSLQIAVV
jgi:hypothetical protein